MTGIVSPDLGDQGVVHNSAEQIKRPITVNQVGRYLDGIVLPAERRFLAPYYRGSDTDSILRDNARCGGSATIVRDSVRALGLYSVTEGNWDLYNKLGILEDNGHVITRFDTDDDQIFFADANYAPFLKPFGINSALAKELPEDPFPKESVLIFRREDHRRVAAYMADWIVKTRNKFMNTDAWRKHSADANVTITQDELTEYFTTIWNTVSYRSYKPDENESENARDLMESLLGKTKEEQTARAMKFIDEIRGQPVGHPVSK